MDQRYEFVQLATKEDANISLLSERFNISRKTAYKWLSRYHSSGTKGLRDHSRRPRTFRNPTLPEVVESIIEVREKTSQLGWSQDTESIAQ